jgi:serine-type D-Ala-D-Ala carboxypeptidase/endopeptidase (penicillin-binding protein 4)
LQTFQVEDPPAFARTLFIEALVRQGVTIDAPAVGTNPADRLTASGAYTEDNRVALLTALLLSEVIKVILKVSMNRGADTLVFLLAVKEDQRTFGEGLQAIQPFLEQIGVDPAGVSLADGRGNERADLSVRARSLRYCGAWRRVRTSPTTMMYCRFLVSTARSRSRCH